MEKKVQKKRVAVNLKVTVDMVCGGREEELSNGLLVTLAQSGQVHTTKLPVYYFRYRLLLSIVLSKLIIILLAEFFLI